jgi:hypothetical protein
MQQITASRNHSPDATAAVIEIAAQLEPLIAGSASKVTANCVRYAHSGAFFLAHHGIGNLFIVHSPRLDGVRNKSACGEGFVDQSREALELVCVFDPPVSR